MRLRILVFFVALFIGLGMSPSTRAIGPSTQSTLVNFVAPVEVNGKILLGKYLIVHDQEKMALGEPCTFFYRWNAKSHQAETPDVSFHCKPTQRAVCAKTNLTARFDFEGRMYRIVEYQFAGDTEAHGIPDPDARSHSTN